MGSVPARSPRPRSSPRSPEKSLEIGPVALIAHKRDGKEHAPEELAALVKHFVTGQMTDYQMSAWLMAAFLRGMTRRETVALTEAMLRSGDVLELRSVKAPKVDKHSTGGVGDKISLCLGPLVAACGAAVPMIAGRGLGHTGGTLDKLEAIPGYDVHLTPTRFERVVREAGVAIMGQTARLAPADRRMYALRDVTGTVESIPLIVASILSKKLAEGIDALVLDVKVGRGAFMKDLASGQRLARTLVEVGRRSGKRVRALLTDMSAPLGRTIGNALEVREAIEVLRDAGPRDVRELTLALGEEMLVAAGVHRGRASARAALLAALRSGAAYERFEHMVRLQGGDVHVVADPRRLPKAPTIAEVLAPRSGYVSDIDALELGELAVRLGAGRHRAEDPVHPAVGIELLVERGARVARGEPLALLHLKGGTPRALREHWCERARDAFTLHARPPAEPRLIQERLR